MYLWANYLRVIRKPRYDKEFERIGTAEDFFELAWWCAKSDERDAKVALIAPGLSGGANSRPTRGMAKALHKEGWDVAVWVYRDTGKSRKSASPTSVRPTYSGYGLDDLSVAVDHVTNQKNYHKVALVGLSLGGNIVIQYVSAYMCASEDNPVPKAVAISPPIAFGQTVEYWSQAIMGRFVISRAAKRGMRRKVEKKVEKVKDDKDPAVSKQDEMAYSDVSTAAEADHYINSEFNEFPGASQYWNEATTLTALRSTRTTTDLLIILAKDDPYLESHSYPHSDALSTSVTMELTANGSHVGFVSRGWTKHRYWSEKRAVDHLSG
jgi:predicted alpha/beta-fold hydrolase